MDYPHMRMATNFPGTQNIDVYKYQNNFDYTRWTPDVHIYLLNVPWDGGYYDVPGFEDDAARDAWFAHQTAYKVELTTETRLLPNGSVKVPVPYDVACNYSYLYIDFPTPTSDSKPLAYESDKRRGRWFFFLSDFKSLAPSTTELTLVLDVWTTYINTVKIANVQLARGHYPMAQTTVDEYLSNPSENNRYLTAAEPFSVSNDIVAKYNQHVINGGEMIACIASTVNWELSFGTWSGATVPGDTGATVPAEPIYIQQGVPSSNVIAMSTSDLTSFVQALDAYAPQVKQAIQGVFFIARDFVRLTQSFECLGTVLYYVQPQQTHIRLADLTKEDFGYPQEYTDIAKLYTSPFAEIELANENGVIGRVKIENTNGHIDAHMFYSLVFPALSLDCVFSGFNGADGSLTFSNITSQAFGYGGDWYKTVAKWDVPTFAVHLSGSTQVKVSTYYSRNAQEYGAANSRTSSIASANTSLQNTQLQIAASETITETNNRTAVLDTYNANELSQALQAWNSGYSRGCVSADSDAETQQAAVSVGNGVIGAIAQGVGSPTPAGIVGAVAGAVANAATTAASTAININLASTKVELGISNTQSQVSSTNSNNTLRTELSTTAATMNNDTQNETAEAVAANNANTAIANANRAYNSAYNSISEGVSQGGMNAPTLYGSTAPGNAVNRPQVIMANVKTVNGGDIAMAGDEMLRFGYTLGRNIDFETFNVMPHFSYWQISRSNIVPRAKGVPQSAVLAIKDILSAGTTVWRCPDEIGEVDIYGNRST